MIRTFAERTLSHIITHVLHAQERLTAKEQAVCDVLMAYLSIKPRTTHQPLVIALVGLVGSGKSAVTYDLAWRLGATVIEADFVRVQLRERGLSYDHVRMIVEELARGVLARGGNVILDSDFVDVAKRVSLLAKVRQMDARVIYIHTYGDFDVVAGRIMSATYNAGSFYGGAACAWKRDPQTCGAVVKTRELWRRTPLHYNWSRRGGGTWIPKKFPFAFASINTTDDQALWSQKMDAVAALCLSEND